MIREPPEEQLLSDLDALGDVLNKFDRHPKVRLVMTTSEAAEYLHITRQLVIRYINAGRLAAQKHGRDWWIELEEVERFEAIPRVEGWKKGKPRK